MGGECGKILLYTLLVSDICKDMAEDRKRTPVRRRDMKTALIHSGEQADRLQRNGFSSRVGACNHHGIEPSAEFDVDRHRGIPVQEWMPGFSKNNPLLSCRGCTAVQRIGKLCLGKYDIQTNKQKPVGFHVCAMCCTFCGEFSENPLNFELFFGCEFPQFIICFDCTHRLNKQSGTGC